MAYLEREAAWSRAGYNGVRQVDSSGMVIASFDHRMSRRGDVQIHTHNAVLNRVRCDDGEWRALDGRALYRVAASAGALYDRVREAALERDLGVRHEQRKPDGPREIVGVDDEVCRLFSSRRVQIEGRLAEMVAAYTARHGAAPSEWVTARMAQWATLETRTAKRGRRPPGRRWPAGSVKASSSICGMRCGRLPTRSPAAGGMKARGKAGSAAGGSLAAASGNRDGLGWIGRIVTSSMEVTGMTAAATAARAAEFAPWDIAADAGAGGGAAGRGNSDRSTRSVRRC